MSGEFGSYCGGYFHTQIMYATDDLRDGTLATTRLWADFFQEFQPIARDIAYAEASDSSEAQAIMTMIQQLPRLKKALADVDAAMDVYRDVMAAAVNKEKEAHR